MKKAEVMVGLVSALVLLLLSILSSTPVTEAASATITKTQSQSEFEASMSKSNQASGKELGGEAELGRDREDRFFGQSPSEVVEKIENSARDWTEQFKATIDGWVAPLKCSFGFCSKTNNASTAIDAPAISSNKDPSMNKTSKINDAVHEQSELERLKSLVQNISLSISKNSTNSSNIDVGI